MKGEGQEEKVEEEAATELTEEDQLVAQVKEKALELLEGWSLLKEVFKIPKKERQAERIKHERAADLGWPPTEERILLPPANPGAPYAFPESKVVLTDWSNLAQLNC